MIKVNLLQSSVSHDMCSRASAVEHCVCSAKGCGFNSQGTHNDTIMYTWMHCKLLWIKVSAKCINVKWFFKHHSNTLIWCSSNILLLLLSIFKTVEYTFFRILWWIEIPWCQKTQKNMLINLKWIQAKKLNSVIILSKAVWLYFHRTQNSLRKGRLFSLSV